MAVWVIREKITPNKIAGLAMGVCGAALLVTSKETTGSGSNVWLGDLFIILNSVFYSFYLVMVKKLMDEYHPLQVIRWVFTIGTLMILPFGWNEFIAAPWGRFSFTEWAAVGFVVLGSTFFAYLFNLYGVRHLGASVTGAYIYSQPIFAALVATIFAGESLSWIKALAAVLIFTGVYLTTYLRR
jgi:drug/metabolite transporter (DMT)-like permease